METAEKECGALGGLFQAIVNDMKVTGREEAGAGPLGRRVAAGSRAPPCPCAAGSVCPCLSVSGLRLRFPGSLGCRVWGV